MKIGITCYPTYGGSGVVATELGLELAERGHEIHFISYAVPVRMTEAADRIHFHEVEVMNGLLPAVERGEMDPMIIFETHITRYNKDHDMESTLRRLFACNYKVKYLASNAELGTKRIDAKGYRRWGIHR